MSHEFYNMQLLAGNCIELPDSIEEPDDFAIPTKEELENIIIGDYVLVRTEYQLIGVSVIDIQDEDITGKVQIFNFYNGVRTNNRMQKGETITFKFVNIMYIA